MIDKTRLGSYNPDGTVKEYPQVDIDGIPYTVALSTARVGNQYFVVLPVNFSNHTLLDSIRAEYATPPRKGASDEN